jgi:hypothetical protein
MADLQHLFQLGQHMQGRLQQLQTELGDRMVEASSGADLVRVTVDGRGILRSLHIAPEIFHDRDADLLADLVLSAVAEAQRRAAHLIQEDMQKVQGLPPGTPAP